MLAFFGKRIEKWLDKKVEQKYPELEEAIMEEIRNSLDHIESMATIGVWGFVIGWFWLCWKIGKWLDSKRS